MHDALLIVDPQNDFSEGGSLAVPGATRAIQAMNRAVRRFTFQGCPIFVSRDWHPEQTTHFDTWPVHCVQGTFGAEFHPDLKLPQRAVIISKGMDPEADAYSAFDGVDLDSGSSFLDELHVSDTSTLYICGIATNVCVDWTVQAALQHNYNVAVLLDLCAGIENPPEGIPFIDAVVADWKANGVDVLKLADTPLDLR